MSQMRRPALHFEKLDVRRAAGIDHGQGFSLGELSPQVNLVHGPNGSGKSTTVRVVQALLWPGQTDLDRPTALGAYRQTHAPADGLTQVSLDAGHVQVHQEGRPIALPDHGPAETRARYRLALHELMVDDNRDFAKIVADASQGGYDLAAVESALGFTDRPASPRKLADTLRDARTTLQQVKADQQEIDQQARQQDELEARRREAIQARVRLGRHEQAREYHREKARLAELEMNLAQQPAALAALRGDEADALKRLAQKRETLLQDQARLRDRLGEAHRQRDELAWPASAGMDDGSLQTAQDLANQLQQVESHLEAQRLVLHTRQDEASQLRRRLSPHLTEAGSMPDNAPMDALLDVTLDDLTDLARQVDKLRAAQADLRRREERLTHSQPAPADSHTVDQIQEGIATLGHWLASPPPAAPPSADATSRVAWPWWVMLASLVVLTALLGLAGAIVLWLVTLPLLGLAGWQLWQMRRPASQEAPPADARVVHQQAYLQTRLPEPTAWEARVVAEQVRHLLQCKQQRLAEDRRQADLAQLAQDRQQLDLDQQTIDQQRHRLESQLGLRLSIDDAWLSRLTALMTQWQSCHHAADAARRALDDLQTQADTRLGRINALLAPYGAAEVANAVAAKRVIDQWQSRLRTLQDTTSQLANHHAQLEQIDSSLEALSKDQQAIYDRLGLDADTAGLPAVMDLMAQRQAYQHLVTQRDKARYLTEHHHAALADEPGLLTLDEAELEMRISRLEQQASQAESLSQEIGRIDGLLRQARQSHAVTDAIHAMDTATTALLDARQAAQGSLAGMLLSQWVRQVAIERTRPQVFERAGELLVHFTRGALELDLDDHAATPRFRARQSGGASRPVEELSVGERVQLLLAVRIAFLEHQESVQLPLLLDETLGTSDDSRAGLIIDALIHLARQGRQIFYFTAQQDEVGKWVARLKEAGVDHHVIDLGQLRQRRHEADTPLVIAPMTPASPPVWEAGMSRLTYGQALDVPALNPMQNRIQDIHLWYLTEDMALLHALLGEQITRWGQLHTLLAHGGAGILPEQDDKAVWDRFTLAAKLVDRAMALWRQGRGVPVDRAALPGPPIITDVFTDRIAQLTQDCQGDARRILAALEDKQILRWRQNNTDELRRHFEEHGHLTDDTPLSIEDIRLRLLAIMGQAPQAHQPTRAWLHQLLAQLDGPASASAASMESMDAQA